MTTGLYAPDGSYRVKLTDGAGNNAPAGSGSDPGYVADAPFTPAGFQTVTVTSAAQTVAQLLTAAAGSITSIPAGTKAIIVQPRADGIRYAHGGSTPTTAADVTGIGVDLFQGQQIPIRLADFSTLKFIAASNTLMSIEFKG
jgi:hypothetical protein